VSAVGASRGARGRAYTLLTPANRYASRLPNLSDALLFKLITPRLSPARFGEYVVAMEAGGGTVDPVAPGFENFLYVLAGEVDLAGERLHERMRPGSWCYLPEDASFGFRAVDGRSELLWLKRRYEAWPGLEAPAARSGHHDDQPFVDDPSVPGFRRRELLDPAEPGYDFNVSLRTPS